MPSAKLTSDGQITVPRGARRALHVRCGDRLSFELRADGTTLVSAQKVELLSLRGSLKPKRRGVRLEQMDEAIPWCALPHSLAGPCISSLL